MRPYTIITFWLNGYISLTGLWVDEFYPISDTTQCSQLFRILPSKRDIEASWLRRTKHWTFHYSIEPDCSKVEITEQLAPTAHYQQWRQLVSQPQDTVQSTTKIAYNRSRRVQHDINYFQWLQATTGHLRSHNYIPERAHSRRKLRELRDKLAHKARHRHRRWWSQVQAFLHVN